MIAALLATCAVIGLAQPLHAADLQTAMSAQESAFQVGDYAGAAALSGTILDALAATAGADSEEFAIEAVVQSKILAQARQVPEALGALRRAEPVFLTLSPNDDRMDAIYAIGLFEMQNGDPRRAVQMFEQAREWEAVLSGEDSLTLCPHHHQPWRDLRSRRSYDLAAQQFERALAIFEAQGAPEADLLQLGHNLGVIAGRRGILDEADRG